MILLFAVLAADPVLLGQSLPSFESWQASLSPDGETVVLQVKGGVLLYDTAGRLRRRIALGESEPTYRLAFSPDGKRIAVPTTGFLAIAELATGRVLAKLEEERHLSPPVFTRDGTVAGYRDHARAGPPDRVVEWARGKVRPRRESDRFAPPDLPEDALGVATAPDGRILVYGPELGVQARNPRTGMIQRLRGIRGVVGVGFPSSGGIRALVRDGGLRLRDAVSGEWMPRRMPGHVARVQSLAFDPTGRALFSAATDGVRVWQTKDWKEVRRIPVPGHASRASLSPEGRHVRWSEDGVWDVREASRTPSLPGKLFALATGIGVVSDREAVPRPVLRSYDLATGKPVGSGYPIHDKILPFDASPDGRRAAVLIRDVRRETRVLLLVDLVTGKELLRRELPERSVMSAFSPDGTTFALATLERIILLDASGERTIRLPRREYSQGPMTFSPDGRLLATVAHTTINVERRRYVGDIRVYELATLGLRRTIQRDGPAPVALAFSPGGSLLATAADESILVWDMARRPGAKPGADWERLGDEDAGKAHEAIASMILAPGRAVPLLRGKLLSFKLPKEDTLRQAIARLADDDFDKRQAAEKTLREAGPKARVLMLAALARAADLEMMQRLRRLLEAAIPDAAHLRRLRGVEVLERIASPEARAVLERLAFPEAKDALARLKEGKR